VFKIGSVYKFPKETKAPIQNQGLEEEGGNVVY